MGGGSVSSHSIMKAESTKSVPGTGHLMIGEMEVPGVEQVKRLGGIITGLTVEKDVTFQVGNIPSQLTFPYSPPASHPSLNRIYSYLQQQQY